MFLGFKSWSDIEQIICLTSSTEIYFPNDVSIFVSMLMANWDTLGVTPDTTSFSFPVYFSSIYFVWISVASKRAEKIYALIIL